MLAPSVLITQPLGEINCPISPRIESPTLELVSDWRILAKQNPVNFSTIKRMCWPFLTMTSAENLEPNWSETVVVSENNVGGKGFKERQV